MGPDETKDHHLIASTKTRTHLQTKKKTNKRTNKETNLQTNKTKQYKADSVTNLKPKGKNTPSLI
jgi:hypothetical protein